MLNTAILFFLGYALGYYFGQQNEKEKAKKKIIAPNTDYFKNLKK